MRELAKLALVVRCVLLLASCGSNAQPLTSELPTEYVRAPALPPSTPQTPSPDPS